MTTSTIISNIAILLMSFPYYVFGQMNTGHQVSQLTKEAKELMDEGHYKAAYKAFRAILDSEKVLPTNLSYYFSETLYHLGQYQNSQNFLDKYLKITGTGGDYYHKANTLLRLLTDKFNEIAACSFCDISGYQLISCTYCNGAKHLVESCHICSGVGIIDCKKCGGEGILIMVGVLDEKKYQTCDRCLGERFHTCTTCLGTKSIKRNCPVCIGSGLEKTTTICNHKKSPID